MQALLLPPQAPPREQPLQVCRKYIFNIAQVEMSWVLTDNSIDDNLSFENCGKRSTRPVALITNALPTYEGEFPWHAAIFARFSSVELPKYACGGSLISKRAVLTGIFIVTFELRIIWFCNFSWTLCDH
jgi:hypothetical protein